MLGKQTIEQRLADINAILNSFQIALISYSEKLPNEQRPLFLNDLNAFLKSATDSTPESLIADMNALLNRYPDIRTQFYSDEDNRNMRFSKHDVIDEESISKKIKEVENQVPPLSKQIEEILKKFKQENQPTL